MKHFLLFIIIISELSFVACRKGPQDPALSFRSRLTRLTGVWNVKYYVVNGADSLGVNFSSIDTTIDSYSGILTCNRTKTFTMMIYNDGSFISEIHADQNFEFHTDSIANDINYIIGISHYTYGTWEFDGGKDGFEKKQLLKLISATGEETFEIVQLRNYEVQLRHALNYPVTTPDTINYILMMGGSEANL